MRSPLLPVMIAACLLFGIASLTHGAEAKPEAGKLKVKVGPFFTQESDKKITLEGTASHVVRTGKRINVTVTVENYGKEKSDPVRLRYVETDKKAGQPRFYRVEAIEPGKKWERTFMARFDESGRKSVTATLLTLEDKPLADESGQPRPDTSSTGSVSLIVKEM